MSRDSTAKVLTVALLLCIVCSVLVSVAAVSLSEKQERNKLIEKRRNILQAAGLYRPDVPIATLFEQVQPYIVDLADGSFRPDIDPTTFDVKAARRDPQTRYEIPAKLDLAGIKAHSRLQEIYLVTSDGQLQQVVLPVYGKGLWSTMYGYISLKDDFTSVNGFAFYEHGETPGLGGEIDNPAWKKQWRGKKIYAADGDLQIEVLKGKVDPESPQAIHQVDGISGATLTARGVHNLLHYWLGENGYRPLLEKLEQEGLPQ